ncbi:DUF2262 domain-containing protein [Chryseobacterium luteum]|nr:DUF2262 domain-containing protein [Chryseobacterium luteum]
MKETWNFKLMDLLKNARLGNTKELNQFLEKYSPFAAANENYSALLLLRNFQVEHWNDERRILNSHPEGENFQWGITIARSSEDISSESHIYLPNSLNYKKLKIIGNEIEIITDKKSIKTNITELFRKLKFFKLSITEQEIENAFDTLSNEQYEEPKKLEVKHQTIHIPSTGILTYNDKLKWYEGKFNTENQIIEVSVYNAEPDDFDKLLPFVDKQMSSKFYDKILLKMESKMIALKNDLWLGEDEETGEDEPPITVEDFRKRVSVTSIVFYEDCSSTIYCSDDDIFWGHTIDINVDKKGEYKDVNLAG